MIRIVLLLFIGFLHASASGYSQVTITLKEKNAPVSKILSAIESQSGYVFIYKSNLIDNLPAVSIDIKDASLEYSLQVCFKNLPVNYNIVDKMIVLKPKDVPDVYNLSGKIINEKGEAVPGATVTVEGTLKSTQTDAAGIFLLTDLQPDTRILVTSVGYEPQELKPGGNTHLIVRLVTAVNKLDEVQVVGYGTVSRRLNTGDVTSVKSEDIARQPVSNVLEALGGRVPGVYIQQSSGVSGSGFTVEIQGRNSLRTSNSNNGNLPFYIVDGVPYSSSSLDANTLIAGQVIPQASPLNYINPSDIESIEILKDADATAIYGSRGANGVILITTKKGKAGNIKLNVTAYTGAGKTDRHMQLLNTAQYLQMRHEAYNNDGATTDQSAYDFNGTWDTTRSANWQKILTGGTAPLTSIQASLSGGNTNTQFLFGGSFFREGTVFSGHFADQKFSGHLNLSSHSNDKRFGSVLSVTYGTDNNNLPAQDPTMQALTLSPVAPLVFDSSGALNWANETWSNPYASFLRAYQGNNNTFIINDQLSYKIFPGLQAKVSAGYNNLQLRQTSITPISAQNPAFSPTGSNYYSTGSTASWILEPQLEYGCMVAGGKLTALAGTTLQQNITQSQSATAEGFASDALIYNISAAPVLLPGSFNYARYRYEAIFARLNYNLDDKYLLNITGRRDGSSRFGPGRQFANFGAAGAAWIFSGEQAVKQHLAFLSYGKLRTSLGVTGNDQIPDYGYLDTYSATGYTYTGISGLTVTNLFNPDFGWESNTKAEAAIDLGFLKDHILLSAAFYRNRSSNQLVGYPLPSITGQQSLSFYNLPATVQNTGWELELSTVNISRSDFKWTSGFTMTIPRNKLISYPGLASSSYVNTYTVGQSLYSKKLYHFTGVDPSTGINTFEDVDKDGSITYPDDLLPMKSVAKNFFGGFQNSVTWKGFQLDIFFQFVKQTGLNYKSFFQSPGTLTNEPAYVQARWQKPGDQTSVQQYTESGPALTAYNNARNYGDNRIGDASFIRLKNLSLSYKAGAYSIFIHCQNLLTITGYKGLDPETQSFQNTPTLKMITAGFSASL